MCGGVGAQYTPAAGWAQAIAYKAKVLGEKDDGAIAVVLGGDASCATGGFWSALTIATTQSLPMLFYIEDNGYGISVTSDYQTPGRDIAANLASFKNLAIWNGDGTEPQEAAKLIGEAIGHVRKRNGPALIRLTVPRLEGHSFQDTQTYKSEAAVEAEWARDPLPKLKIRRQSRLGPDRGVRRAGSRGCPSRGRSARRLVARPRDRSCFLRRRASQVGGGAGLVSDGTTDEPQPEGQRINMVTAIRRVLDQELEANPKVLVFGEDVGPQGRCPCGDARPSGQIRRSIACSTRPQRGRHRRPRGGHGARRADAGAEIQFRKYAEPATEQINDCGTMRWRTANRFSAPMVLRIPGGFFKCGDPWHSQTNEVQFVHNPGWKVAVPSNAEDAVGLLARRLRGNDPVIFFEHRAMLDDSWARRPWPGDKFVLPFGKAKKTREGDRITIVTWGAMVPRCEAAAEGVSADVIDLRTLMPWDRETVLDSVRRHAALPDRPRRSAYRRLRRGDRRGGCRRGVPRSRRAGRARDHARHSEPASSQAARMGGAHRSRRSAPRSTGWWGSDDRGPRSRRAGRHQGGRPRLAQAGRRRWWRRMSRWSSWRPTRSRRRCRRRRREC